MQRSLRARITLGLALLAATLALAVGVAIVTLSRLGGAVDTILRENYRSVVAAQDMAEALEREDAAALFAAMGRDDLARPALAAHRPRFDAALARAAANVTLPGEGRLIATLRARHGDYAAAADRALALPVEARRAAYFRDLRPRGAALRGAIEEVRGINQAHMVAADHRARAMARRSMWVVVAVGLVAVLIAALVSWLLPRALVRPVRALAAAARAVGEGNFHAAVAPPQAAELAELAVLAEAFGRMLEQLRAYRESSLGELLAARDLAQATLACLLDPVMVFGHAGDVLLANAAAEETFGVRAGSAEELRRDDVTIPPALLAARDRVVAAGEPVLPRNFAEAMRHQGRGGERSFLVRAAPVRLEGAAPGVVVVAQDITRFRRIDELKSDVVATVSHELKTPLTSLRMAAHLLLEPAFGPLTSAQTELVTTARDDTERLQTLVDELLDLARIEAEAGALRRTPVEPVGLLAEAAEAHRALAAEKGVALEVVPRGPVGAFPLDPERTAIVLANLVSNAIRHTPRGGTVALLAERAGGGLRLAVRDTGEGIDPRELPRIFERFHRGGEHPGRERQGLGLAIAREIVRQHGGELSVASAPGAGATFTVDLPPPA